MRALLKNPNFQSILKNWLYRNVSNEDFSIPTLIAQMRSTYPDLFLNIREETKTGKILDLFVAFKNRISNCKNFSLLFLIVLSK